MYSKRQMHQLVEQLNRIILEMEDNASIVKGVHAQAGTGGEAGGDEADDSTPDPVGEYHGELYVRHNKDKARHAKEVYKGKKILKPIQSPGDFLEQDIADAHRDLHVDPLSMDFDDDRSKSEKYARDFMTKKVAHLDSSSKQRYAAIQHLFDLRKKAELK